MYGTGYARLHDHEIKLKHKFRNMQYWIPYNMNYKCIIKLVYIIISSMSYIDFGVKNVLIMFFNCIPHVMWVLFQHFPYFESFNVYTLPCQRVCFNIGIVLTKK